MALKSGIWQLIAIISAFFTVLRPSGLTYYYIRRAAIRLAWPVVKTIERGAGTAGGEDYYR